MYVNSGYLYGSRTAFKDHSRPLIVGSAGTYRLIKRPFLPTQRPKGRVDYQLLYVAAGKVHFFFQGKEEILPAGTMVLYRPGEPQKYIYYAQEHPEVYWVHFTGYDVKNILDFYGLPKDANLFYTGTSPEFKRLFRQMIQELQLCRPMYEEVLTSILNHIFLLIARLRKEDHIPGTAIHDEIEQAVHYFNDHYNEDIGIEKYAEAHHISPSWFTRGFKQYTGMTPMQYILSIRMANAQFLLEQTSSNISEIAAIVGYDNPLYFSRLFKKQFGMSPVQYRKEKTAAE